MQRVKTGNGGETTTKPTHRQRPAGGAALGRAFVVGRRWRCTERKLKTLISEFGARNFTFAQNKLCSDAKRNCCGATALAAARAAGARREPSEWRHV
jgi:hypothetical protein